VATVYAGKKNREYTMKTSTTRAFVLLAVASLSCGVAVAHGHGGGGHGGGHWGGGGHHWGGGGFHGYYGGFYGFGFPFYGYRYGSPYYPYGFPYYSQAPVIAPPITYIQQTPPAAQENAAGYWYYCQDPEGYYPHVKTCPKGWQKVSPTPADK
jgi:hypothetical protein